MDLILHDRIFSMAPQETEDNVCKRGHIVGTGNVFIKNGVKTCLTCRVAQQEKYKRNKEKYYSERSHFFFDVLTDKVVDGKKYEAKRSCLRCDNSFVSESKNNRICGSCKGKVTIDG